jgi:hypothetical protein
MLRQTLAAMDDVIPSRDRAFVVLWSADKVPMMAGCVRCGCKFFTPSTIKREALVAQAYLEEKFARHACVVERLPDRPAGEKYFG